MALVVFIDALPFTYVESNKELIDGLEYASLKPNVGFSSNLHWQLFAGKYPDDIGFFTDWNLADENDNKIAVLSSVFKLIEPFPLVSSLGKNIIDRFLPGPRLANIPSSIRSNFKETAKYLLMDSKLVRDIKMFENYNIILEDELKIEFEEIISLSNKAIKDSSDVFISFGFFDKYGHILGRGREYDEKMTAHFQKIINLVNQYRMLYPSENIIIVSDHGMSNIKENVSIDLEGHFGKQKKERYMSFCDSTTLRIWIEDKSLKSSMKDYLSSIDFGHLMTEEERKYYRVTSKDFGDLIFILHEGYIFSPNYFGMGLRTKALGMHGYWPGPIDQNGAIITNMSIQSQNDYRDFYEFLKKAVI